MTGWTIDFSAFADAWRWVADPELCGAHFRTGLPCRGIPVWRPEGKAGKSRCRMHSGRPTGLRTANGRARIRPATEDEQGLGAEVRKKFKQMHGVWTPPEWSTLALPVLHHVPFHTRRL